MRDLRRSVRTGVRVVRRLCVMSEHRQEFDNELEAHREQGHRAVRDGRRGPARGHPGAAEQRQRGVRDCWSSAISAIDALYVEVEGLANREIVLQAPVASDLRFLLSVLRIVPELERSHDLVVHIAASASHFLGVDLSPRARGWWSGWATSPPRCGGRRPTRGTSGTGPRRWPSPSATRSMDELHAQPHRRARLRRHRRPRGDGDGAGRAGLRAARRARRQHRPPRGLPGGLLPGQAAGITGGTGAATVRPHPFLLSLSPPGGYPIRPVT